MLLHDEHHLLTRLTGGIRVEVGLGQTGAPGRQRARREGARWWGTPVGEPGVWIQVAWRTTSKDHSVHRNLASVLGEGTFSGQDRDETWAG